MCIYFMYYLFPVFSVSPVNLVGRVRSDLPFKIKLLLTLLTLPTRFTGDTEKTGNKEHIK